VSLSALPDVSYRHQDRAQPVALRALPAIVPTFTDELPSFDEPVRVVRTVLVVDVVESVRLMQEDEAGTVRRWRAFVDYVVNRLLPGEDGRLVKSLGDGLMLECARVGTAVSLALAMQEAIGGTNAVLPANRRLHLRIGIHVSPLIADALDVYGHGVNLAARLTTLAGPDEIVVSADVRDQLTPALDADVEDLGECYVKHLAQPVRAYRLGQAGERPVVEPGCAALQDLRPTIAVIPFQARSAIAEHVLLGQILADEVISALSHSPDLHVVSRLSTTAFSGRNASAEEVGAFLHANYVLSGTYHADRDRVSVHGELAEARTGQVVWSKSLKGSLKSVVSGNESLAERLVSECRAALMLRELQRSQRQALPTLESYTLLLSGVALMHRLSPVAFGRSREMLQLLIDRSPRLALPYAWLAKWHVLRVQQGWSTTPREDARYAIECTKRALDNDATCSLALAVDGFVHTNLLKEFSVAESRYELALAVNPNESLAWLLLGTLFAFRGQGKDAVRNTRHAIKLSPLDPLRYFYDSLAATAALSAGQYEKACELARRSFRLNRAHTSTLRALAIALWQLGRADEARSTVSELLRLDPSFTVSRYREVSPSAGFETWKIWSEALESAGVPK
jgi:class 3 adenylate cyclase/tetratricopeptide (TPR) repeat protein